MCRYVKTYIMARYSPFLDATTHLYKRSCLSVRPSVGPSVPRYFQMTNMAIPEAKKSTDFINNDTMSHDEVQYFSFKSFQTRALF